LLLQQKKHLNEVYYGHIFTPPFTHTYDKNLVRINHTHSHVIHYNTGQPITEQLVVEMLQQYKNLHVATQTLQMPRAKTPYTLPQKNNMPTSYKHCFTQVLIPTKLEPPTAQRHYSSPPQKAITKSYKHSLQTTKPTLTKL